MNKKKTSTFPKNVPIASALLSALFGVLSPLSLGYLFPKEPVYAYVSATVAFALAVFSAYGFTRVRQDDRNRRNKLALALEYWQGEASGLEQEAQRQSKLRELISLDLQKEKEIAQNYLDVANIFLAAIDKSGQVEMINKKGVEILGCQERDILGEDFADFCVPDLFRSRVRQEIESAMRGEKQIMARMEYPISTLKGERLVSWSNSVIKDLAGNPKALLLCGEDVTDRRSVEARLNLMRMTLESVDEGVIAIDAQGLIVWSNPACEKISGFVGKGTQGRSMTMMYLQEEKVRPLEDAMKEMMLKGSWKGEIKARHFNGKSYPQRLSLSAIKDNAGNITHAVAVFSDISKEKEQEDRVHYLASHDTLTGLPNRASFTNRLEEALERASRTQTKLAILFIDLDHFKKVNDTLGHEAGDNLLVEVAQRLKQTLNQNNFIARLGGDEFTAILESLTIQKAQSIANDLLEVLSEKYKAVGDNADIRVTPSIGICMYPDDGLDAQSLLKKSDQAMYAVKSSGRAGVRFFTPDITAKEIHYRTLESKLRKALNERSLSLYFQPKVDLTTNQFVGFEALARWQEEDGNYVSPEEFISFAEETGLIIELGHWVIDSACEHIAKWSQEGLSVSVAINVSPRQFKDDSLLGHLKNAIEKHGIHAGQLEVELTESSLMKDAKSVKEFLYQIKDLGCSITIDDFGTGYSSLLRLRDFPIDFVKIDKGFVLHANKHNSDGAICKAVVGLAQALNLKIVAEGIETEEHATFLQSIGANYGQGFLYSKALNGKEAKAWLSNHQKR